MRRVSSNLATTAQGSSDKVESFYLQLNKDHHKMDEDEMTLRSMPELQNTELPPRPKPGALYDPDDVIKPRIKITKLLAAYCVQIDNVANAKNTSEADSVVKNLNGTVQTIGGDLLNWSGLQAKLAPSISALASPVKTLSELGLQAIFRFLRDKWAKDLIQSRDAAFEDVCVNLTRDLNNVGKDAKQRAKNIAHLWMVVSEKRRAQHASQDGTKNANSEYDKASQFVDTVAANNPADVFDQERDEFHELATWAVAQTPTRKWPFSK